MLETGQWIVAHYLELGAIVLAAVSLAEMVVRLTPTKSDDGAVERVGGFIRRIFDFLRIPNRKSE